MDFEGTATIQCIIPYIDLGFDCYECYGIYYRNWTKVRARIHAIIDNNCHAIQIHSIYSLIKIIERKKNKKNEKLPTNQLNFFIY